MLVGLLSACSSACSSARPLLPRDGSQDFSYEFRYQAGDAAPRTLYRGTDAQHYFALPAGEPEDGHQGESPGDGGTGCACALS